jgi:ABC-type nitrate/sulfonate/bicarbonate transport system substrate-binding protein
MVLHLNVANCERMGKKEVKVKKLIVPATLVTVVCLAFSSGLSCTKKQEVVRMAAVKAAYYLPLMVAQDQHLFEKRGLKSDLLFFNSNNDMMNAFLHGEADISALGSGGAFSLEAASPGRIRFIYGQTSASYSLLVPASSRVANLEDLKGKRVGTWPSPTSRALLQLILEPRIGKGSFEVVPTDFRFLNQVMKRGDVAALFDTDIYTQQAIDSGEARYLSRNPVEEYVLSPFFNGGGLVAKDLQQKNPKLMSEILDVLDQAIIFIKEHELEARMSLVTYIGISEKIARQAPIDKFLVLKDVDIANAQKVADIFSDQGVVVKKIEVRGMFQ